MNKIRIKDIFYINQQNVVLSDYKFINYLDTSNITTNQITDIQKLNVKTKEIPSRARRFIKENTIIYSAVRPNLKHYGIIRKPLENMVVSTGFITLDIKDEFSYDVNYLYYNLTQNKYTNYLHTIACNNVSSYPAINPSDIENLEIEIESDVNIQKKIARLLTNIDSKIELNNKINEELEKIAKTLYDYWFVQFDFPDENNRPYKSSGGAMKRSYSLEVLCIRGTDIPTINLCNMPEMPIRYISKSNSFKVLKRGDLIIEISGGSQNQSTGRIAYIDIGLLNRLNRNVITSNFCKAISLKSSKYMYNFYLEWKALYNQGIFFNFEGKTTGIKNLLYEDFIRSYNTVIPDDETVSMFNDIISPIYREIQRNCAEAINLIKLRDFLLPMLMNGQVKVI